MSFEFIHYAGPAVIEAASLGSKVVASLPAGIVPMIPGTVSLPDISSYIETAITVSFQYGMMIFGALIGIAGVGIGFRFGFGLIAWVGKMIGDAFSGMR